MILYTAHWNEARKVGQKTFRSRTAAIEFGREKVKAANCSPVSIWRYSITGNAADALVLAHDGAEWWQAKQYEGTILKDTAFTKGR
jgi:hypothetical protein